MRTPILIITLFINCYFGFAAPGIFTLSQNQILETNCYQVLESNSGFNSLYDNVLEEKSCEVKTFLEPYTNIFQVLSFDLQPLHFYTDQEYGYEIARKAAWKKSLKQVDHFLMITKSFDDTGNIFYTAKFKLPQNPVFDIATEFDIISFEHSISEAMNNEAALFTNDIDRNVSIELIGMEKFHQVLQDIIDGDFGVSEEFLIANEFEEAPLGEVQLQNTTDKLITTQIKDYAGYKFYSETAVDFVNIHLFAKEAFNQMPWDAGLIMTDDQSTINGGDEMQDANNSFENNTESKIILWLHFHEVEDGFKLFFKSKSNISESEANEILEEHFNNYYDETPITLDANPLNRNGENACIDFEWTKKWRTKTHVIPNLSGCIDQIQLPQQLLLLEESLLFFGGITCGLIDGFIETADMVGSVFSGGIRALSHAPFNVFWFIDCFDHINKEWSWEIGIYGNINQGILSKVREDIKFWTDTYDGLKKFVDGFELSPILNGIYNSIKVWFADVGFMNGSELSGYQIGKVMFEILIGLATAGSSTAINVAKQAGKVLKNGYRAFKTKGLTAIKNSLDGQWLNLGKKGRTTCNILTGGCFTGETLVWLANNSRKYLPIKEIQLFDQLEVRESKIIDDFYTSIGQKESDQFYPLSIENNSEWFEVDFEEIEGKSACKMAMRQVELEKNNYHQNKFVHLQIPEQSINGQFRITSIKHVLPQKIPDGIMDEGSGIVTGIFIHQSSDVYEIILGKNEVFRVTYSHPIFSVPENNWVPAGSLISGDELLGKEGLVKVQSVKKLAGTFKVYNLEVRDHHTYLVGVDGVLVHNICWKEVSHFLRNSLAEKKKFVTEAFDAWYPGIFAKRAFLEALMRKTKFKDWKHTYDIAKNFKAIDFYRWVNGKNIVVSMKTTRVNTVTKWINQNKKHLDDLVQGKKDKIFEWNKNKIPTDEVQLYLFTKKALTTAEKISWQSAIKAHTNNKIQVIIKTIEESL